MLAIIFVKGIKAIICFATEVFVKKLYENNIVTSEAGCEAKALWDMGWGRNAMSDST